MGKNSGLWKCRYFDARLLFSRLFASVSASQSSRWMAVASCRRSYVSLSFAPTALNNLAHFDAETASAAAITTSSACLSSLISPPVFLRSTDAEYVRPINISLPTICALSVLEGLAATASYNMEFRESKGGQPWLFPSQCRCGGNTFEGVASGTILFTPCSPILDLTYTLAAKLDKYLTAYETSQATQSLSLAQLYL